MSPIWTALALILTTQSPAASPENPLFRSIMAEGRVEGATTVRLPEPTLSDDLDVPGTKAALKAFAGDDQAVKELLRDSITAPFVLKTRDLKAADTTIRVVDLWFVIHTKLEDVDPNQILGRASSPPVEVGNMRFEAKSLTENDLLEKKRSLMPPIAGRKEGFTHVSGRLLDRIEVEATDHSVATRSPRSLLIASRTDRGFDDDPTFPNRWTTLTRNGAVETRSPSRVYGGSLGYAKLTEINGEPGALLVESHFAFFEPIEWFQGNPILRSKLSLIAQDQIRRLRREIQKKRSETQKAN